MNFKIKKPDLRIYAKLPNPGLLSFLNNNELGLDLDVRTPLFNKRPRNDIVKEWEFIFNNNRSKLYRDLIDFEVDEINKIGRYSCMFPFHDRFNDVKSYYEHEFSESNLDSYEISLLNEAFKQYYKKFNKFKHSIRLCSFNSVIDSIPLNTNSGLPLFTKRRLVIKDTLDQFNEFNGCDLSSKQNMINELCCVLGWRGQPVDKQRVVWMFPMLINILEAQYYKPRIRQIQKNMLKPEFLSQDDVEINITKLFKSKNKSDLVIATDFSKFDQHYNSVLQNISFKNKLFFINNMYNYDDIELNHYFKFYIKLICTRDIIFEGHHGMSTGSSGTNMDANESHHIMQLCCANSFNSKLNDYSTVLGDDGIISFPGITPDYVADFYTKTFGQEMNIEKQYVSFNSTKYLQRLYSTDYVDVRGKMLSVYSTFRALGRLLGQERYADPELWNKEMVIIRSWSIIENLSNHPLFNEFVDFIINGDKYQLGILIPGFIEKLGRITVNDLMNMVPKSISYAKYLEFENLPNSKIRNWRIFKYLSSKLRK